MITNIRFYRNDWIANTSHSYPDINDSYIFGLIIQSLLLKSQLLLSLTTGVVMLGTTAIKTWRKKVKCFESDIKKVVKINQQGVEEKHVLVTSVTFTDGWGLSFPKRMGTKLTLFIRFVTYACRSEVTAEWYKLTRDEVHISVSFTSSHH